MPMYTFHLCNADGRSPSFEAFELPTDGDVFAQAERLLVEHRSCDHVDVWESERPLLSLHRDQPIFRPISEAVRKPMASAAGAP